MRERVIERKLVEAVEQLGGMAPKFVSPGTDGMPDRMVFLPGGLKIPVETKAPGEKLRKLQAYRKKQLADLGTEVWVIDDEVKLNTFIRWATKEMAGRACRKGEAYGSRNEQSQILSGGSQK
jgi:hypothetical protein